eukprot:5085184-Pleurochrysis_carterae.AAC.1
MNVINQYQSRSQSADVDFKPLIDHYTAMEHSTKYATKFEKASCVFERLIADALDRCKDAPEETTSISICKVLGAADLRTKLVFPRSCSCESRH